MRTITIILDIIFLMVLIYFMQGLSWEHDKESVVGFVFMVVTLVMNICLIYW